MGQQGSLQILKKSSRWLNDFAADFHSQTGEDGVIAKALEMLPTRDRWCVEFGAWDGSHLSNTFNLVENHQYHVVLIEGDRGKFESLRNNYPFKDPQFLQDSLLGGQRKITSTPFRR